MYTHLWMRETRDKIGKLPNFSFFQVGISAKTISTTIDLIPILHIGLELQCLQLSLTLGVFSNANSTWLRLNDWSCGKQFCFPKTLYVSRGEAERKQNSLFPTGPVIKCFATPPNLKVEKTAKKLFALLRLAHKFAAVSRNMGWSHASRNSKLSFPQRVNPFLPGDPLIDFTLSNARRFY